MIGVLRRALRRRRPKEAAMTRCRHCRQTLDESNPRYLVHNVGGRYCDPTLTGGPVFGYIATLNRPRIPEETK